MGVSGFPLFNKGIKTTIWPYKVKFSWGFHSLKEWEEVSSTCQHVQPKAFNKFLNNKFAALANINCAYTNLGRQWTETGELCL